MTIFTISCSSCSNKDVPSYLELKKIKEVGCKIILTEQYREMLDQIMKSFK